jgi:FtsP/CotA-like multicopper oxidase with cupredoxin domain
VEGLDFSGGPLEILVNNTKWMGARPDDMDPNNMMGMPVNGGISDGNGNYLTELPQEGDTEVWEIINTTMDAHPIHTHLAQFQLLNRQAYDLDSYLLESYEPAFPSGVFKPAYGPPLSYKPSKASGWKYGGNPDVTPYLLRRIESPDSNEAGWKDTVMVPPGMVTRIVVRWAPTDIPILPKILAGFLHYNFVPNDIIPGNKNAIFDYVWHCHIVDHEDNEMMRPDAVVLNPWTPNGLRSYKIGRDY